MLWGRYVEGEDVSGDVMRRVRMLWGCYVEGEEEGVMGTLCGG